MRISDWSSDVCSSDLAICVTKAVAKDMIAARIGTVTPMVVAAPKYLQRRGRPTTPFDLNEHDCLTVKSRSGVVYPWHFMKDDKQYRSEEHTSELQSLMRISYAVFCLKKKKNKK